MESKFLVLLACFSPMVLGYFPEMIPLPNGIFQGVINQNSFSLITQVNELRAQLKQLAMKVQSMDAIDLHKQNSSIATNIKDIDSLEARIDTVENSLDCSLETPDRIGRKYLFIVNKSLKSMIYS